MTVVSSVVNIYEIAGMPETEAEQNALIDSGFEVSNIHVHNVEEDKYYVVRVTTVDDSKFQAIRKLDPKSEVDAVACNEVLAALADVINNQASVEDESSTDSNAPTI